MERRLLDEVVYGIHAVAEALASDRPPRSVHLAADRAKDGALRALLARARERGVAVRFEPRTFFAPFPFKAHQGVVAFAASFAYATLHDVMTAPARGAHRLYVVLDHLTDPHNVGAIVRTAECAGADAVILPERRSAGLNATARKAAAGAAERLPIVRTGNLADAVRRLRGAGMWIVGADAGADAVEMSRADLDRDLALVVGAEGKGLSPLLRRECDYLVRVPMHGRIPSLNASVAAALLLYEAIRGRRPA